MQCMSLIFINSLKRNKVLRTPDIKILIFFVGVQKFGKQTIDSEICGIKFDKTNLPISHLVRGTMIPEELWLPQKQH